MIIDILKPGLESTRQKKTKTNTNLHLGAPSWVEHFSRVVESRSAEGSWKQRFSCKDSFCKCVSDCNNIILVTIVFVLITNIIRA